MSDPVSYTAVLPVSEQSVWFVFGLLAAERRRRGARGRPRALGCYRQAVLVLRWFLDSTWLAQLAAGNWIGRSTAYRYLHEGIDVLAAAAPGLREALLAARAAGHSHVTVDGTRLSRPTAAMHPARPSGPPGPIPGWACGGRASTAATLQVLAAPDGWPLGTSPVRPGREHDTTALPAHLDPLPLLAE